MVCFGHSDVRFPDKPLEFPADYNEENWWGLTAVMLPLNVLILLAEGTTVIPMIYPAFWYLMIGDFLHQSLILLYRFHENTMI